MGVLDMDGYFYVKIPFLRNTRHWMLKLKQWQLNHKITCKCASLRFPEFAKVDYM